MDPFRQRIQLILEEAEEPKVYRTLADLDDEFDYMLERDMRKSNNLTAKYLYDAIELFKDGKITSKHDLFYQLNLPVRPTDKYSAVHAFLKKIKWRYRFYVFDELPTRSNIPTKISFEPVKAYSKFDEVDNDLLTALKNDGRGLCILLLRAIEIHRRKPFTDRDDMIMRLGLDKSAEDGDAYLNVILSNWRTRLKVSIFDDVKTKISDRVSKERQFIDLIKKYPDLTPVAAATRLGANVSTIAVYLSRAKSRGEIPRDFKMARQDYGTLRPDSGMTRYG